MSPATGRRPVAKQSRTRAANNAAMATFLFKTEPGEYSFADLERDRRTTWSGVTNPQALIHLRACAIGDEVFVYHTGAERAVVGLARVVGEPRPDPAVQPADPRRAAVDIAPVRPLASPVTLAAIKADERFAEFALVRQSRLSVMPVPAGLARAILAMAGEKPARR